MVRRFARTDEEDERVVTDSADSTPATDYNVYYGAEAIVVQLPRNAECPQGCPIP